MEKLGTPAVTKARQAHVIVELRKAIKIQKIEECWPDRDLTSKLSLDTKYERYLGHMALAAASFTIQEAY